MDSKIIKIAILFLSLLTISINSYGANITTSVCPTFVSGNTYILDGYTSGSVCTINADNVTITSNGEFQNANALFLMNTRSNIVFDNINILDLTLIFSGVQNNIEVKNNIIQEFSGYSDGGNVVGFIIRRDFTDSNPTFNNLVVTNNYFEAREDLTPSGGRNFGIFSCLSGSSSCTMTLNDVTFEDNTFLNFHTFFGTITGSGRTTNFIVENLSSTNNIYDLDNAFFSESGAGSGGMTFNNGASCNIAYTNDMFTHITITSDNDLNFRDDITTILTEDSCTYFNENLLTQKFTSSLGGKALIHTEGTPNYYDSETKYYLIEDISLDTSDYISFANSQFSEFILIGGNDITSTNTNLIRLGSNNRLTSDYLTIRPKIIVNSVINVNYNASQSAFLTNWNIISFGNMVEIDNLEFESNGAGSSNFGWIRGAQLQQGQNLYFHDNVINYLTPMLNDETPFIYGADFMKIINNNFTISNHINRTISGGSAQGGHLIQDNIFDGAGFVFNDLSTILDTFVTKANHNKFLNTSGFNSFPFDPALGGETPDSFTSTFVLNGSYFYETTCDSYEFNLGNQYFDYIDPAVCIDGNSDNICDTPILRSNNASQITDYRPLKPFPYPFANHTGGIIPEDLCGSFSFDVQSPINNTNYNLSAGESLTITWSFSSTSYPTMSCFVNLNDFQEVIIEQDSGEIYSKDFELITGKYNFEVTCENEFIEFSSGNFNFTINDGSIFETPPSPTIPPVLGCTDPTANNFNPLATQDDGTCTYSGVGQGGGQGTNNGILIGEVGADGFFSQDITESKNSVVTMFSLFETPLAWGYLIGFLVIAFAFLAVMIALMRGLIGV